MSTNVSRYEMSVLEEIAQRACDMAHDAGHEYEKMTALMDIESAHTQIPMHLDKLRDADDFNFAHDVFGIRGHMDRTEYPGKLTGCFVPRFAMKQGE